MVDNLVVASATSTGATVKTEDIGGIHFGVVKPYIGASGAAAPVHSGNPLPITGTVNVTAGNVPIPVTAAGGVFAVSARNVVTVQGVVQISAGNPPIPVTAAEGVFAVSARNIVTVAGTVNISAANVPIPVTAAGGVFPAAGVTNTIVSGAQTITPKFADIDVSVSGHNILVSAVAAKKLRVLTYAVATKSSVEATFRSEVTNITGPMQLVNGISGPNGYPVGLFETAVSADLVLWLGAAVSAGGHITYIEVD